MGETVMYSIDPKSGKTVRHVLPWDKDNPKITPAMRELHAKGLAKYISRGYTFEPPKVETPKVVEVVPAQTEGVTPVTVAENGFACPTCGKKFTRKIALSGHLRTHQKK